MNWSRFPPGAEEAWQIGMRAMGRTKRGTPPAEVLAKIERALRRRGVREDLIRWCLKAEWEAVWDDSPPVTPTLFD